MSVITNTIYVFESAEKAEAAGYTGEYYTSIIDAVKAASATGKTTIIVGDGTYSGDVAFIQENISETLQNDVGVSLDDSEIVGEQKGDIVIKAAEGAEKVTFTGTFLMGFRKQGLQTENQKWSADVEFDGITFDHAENAKHSIVALNSSDLIFKDCTIVGDGEYGIGSNGQNGCEDVTFTNCTLENAGIQAYGGFLSDLKFDNCTFNDSRVNMASAGNATFSDCEFNVTFTESNTTETIDDETVSANFYVLRVPSNGGLTVNIENGCEFNVDSTLSATAAPAADKYWTIFANRNTGSAVTWNIADVEVNFTDAAMNNENIKLSAIDPKKAASIKDTNTTITNMTSTSNNVDELLAKSDGKVTVKEVDNSGDVISNAVYQNGTLQSKEVSILYLNGESYTGSMDYKTIKAASGESKITDADIDVKGLLVGNNEINNNPVDDNVSSAAKLTLSGVTANVTGGEGINSGLWVGKDTGVANKGKYQLILKKGTVITGPGSTNITDPGCVTGASVRNDGYLEISEGSMVKVQWMPIEGGVKITGKDSVLDIQSGNVFGDNAIITIEDGGKFQLVGIDRNVYPALNIGYGEEKAVINVKNGGTLLVDGAADGAHGSITINKNGVVNVNGGTLNVTDGAVLTNSGTIIATDASITAGIVDTNRRLKIVRDGDVSAAATATVEFYSAYGKTGTKTVSFEAGKDTVYLDVDAFSYKYKVICNGVTKEYNAGNAEFELEGDFEVAGKTTLAIENLIGTATVKDNAVVTGSVGSKVADTIDVVGKNVTFSNFKLNEGVTGYNAAQVKVKEGASLIVAEGSIINAGNLFQVKGGSAAIAADSSVTTANFEVWDVAGKASTVTIDGTVNATVFMLTTQNEKSSSVTVNAGATLNVGGGQFKLQTGTMTVYGYVNGNGVLGGGSYGYCGSGVQNGKSYPGSLTIDGTYAAEDNNNGKFTNVGDQKFYAWLGDITLQNNALFDWAADVGLWEDSTLTVKSGSTFKTGGVLDFDGKIIMDATSLIIADSIEDNEGAGTITVDAKGWSGFAKVVDLTTGEDAVDVVITGNSDAYQVTNGNDTYVTTADKSNIILVDLKETAFGTALGTAGKYIAGVNAFRSVDDAFGSADNTVDAMNATKNIYVYGTSTGSWSSIENFGTLNFQKFDTGKADQPDAIVNIQPASGSTVGGMFTGDLTIGAGVTLNANYGFEGNGWGNFLRFMPAGSKSTVTVDGTLTYSGGDFGVRDSAAVTEDNPLGLVSGKEVAVVVNKTGKMFANGDSNNTFYANSSLTVTGTGTAEKKMEEVQFQSGSYTSFLGDVKFENTNVTLYGASSYLFGDGELLPKETFAGDKAFTAVNSVINVVGGSGAPDDNRNAIGFDKTTTLKNTDINAGDMFINGKTFTMEGGKLDLEADTAGAYGANYTSKGDLTIAAGATLAMTNAALDAEGTVTNKGTLTVNGKSTLNIGELSGNRINLAAGTTLTDSAVDGSVNMLGDLKLVDGSDDDVNGLNLGKGGLWASNGGKLSGDKLVARYAMFQKGVYTISTDMVLEYGYLSFGGTFTVSSTIQTGVDTDGDGTVYGGDVFYIRGSVDLISGGKIDSDNGLYLDNANSILKIGTGATVDASNVNISRDTAQLIVNGGSFVAGSVTNNGTITISGNSTINATITGNAAKVSKGAVLTVVDSAFADGVDSYTMMLDVYSLANLKSINGVAVSGNATAGYSIKIGDVLYSIADKDANGLVFTALKDDQGNTGSIEADDYNGSLDGLTSDYVVEAKAGTATLKVNKGQSATVAAITKDENGGVTNLNLNGDLTVGTTNDHGSVEAVGKITTGSDVEVKMGDVSGTNLNSTIGLGKNNTAFFDNIDLKGGSNTLSIGSNSDVEVDDIDNTAAGYIKNVKTINLANGTAANAKKGTEADYTTLTVTGDITAPAMSNSITLGNYAKLFVDGNLDNSDVNVGTTIKAGNYSEVIFGKPDVNGNITGGKVTSLAGLSIGTEGVFKAASVSGTSGNNTISFGNNATAKVKGDINLLAGNDTIKTGTGALVEVSGDVKGVETISLGKGAVMLVGKVDDATDTVTTTDVIGLAGLTLASGSAAKFDKTGNEIAEEVNTIFAAGDVYGTEKNNTINVGNFGIFTADSIDMFDGNDTIKTGSDSEFVVATFDQQGNKDHADIVNVETISIGARSVFAAEDIIGVNKLTAANGSYDKKTDKAIYTILGTEGFIEGTAQNDTISLGNWNHAVITGGIDMLDGSDTIKVGSDSILFVGNDQPGPGNLVLADIANVETISIGARSIFAAEDITGVNKLTAANGVKDDTTQILATGTVTGTAQNDTISLGNWSAAHFGKIDLGAGNNTIKIGNNSYLYAGAIYIGDYTSASTLSIGADVNFTASSLTWVNKLTVGNGTTFTIGSIAGSGKNDTITFGNNNIVTVNSISLQDGNDTIMIGNDSTVTVSGTIYGAETINIGSRSSLIAGTISAGLKKLTAANGSYDKKTGTTSWTEVEADYMYTGNGNDSITFGNYNDVDIADLRLQDGNDTLKIGNDSVADFGKVDLGSGNDIFNIGDRTTVTATNTIKLGNDNDTFKIGNDSTVIVEGSLNFGSGKDTMTIGKNSVVKFESINMYGGDDTINASKGAELWFNNGAADADLTGVAGSWKNATIFDDMGVIDANGEFGGSVYANEWDVFEVGATINYIKVNDKATEVWYSVDNGNSWNEYPWETGIAGDVDLIKVGVDFSDKDQYAKKEYTITVGLA